VTERLILELMVVVAGAAAMAVTSRLRQA